MRLTAASWACGAVKERVDWHRAKWEDMPTQYNIVNCLAELEILEYRGATITQTIGGKDLSDQRILE